MKKYLLLILVLVTCNLNGQETTKKSKTAIKHTTNRGTKAKLYKLNDPINLTDFQVTYNWNNEETYSSTDSVFLKSYSNTERRLKFGLTKEEKALIYKTVKAIDFFNLPTDIMSNEISISPSFSTEISIKIKGKVHSVYYNNSGYIKDKSIEKRFKEIQSVIGKIIFDRKAVKALPESDRALFIR